MTIMREMKRLEKMLESIQSNECKNGRTLTRNAANQKRKLSSKKKQIFEQENKIPKVKVRKKKNKKEEEDETQLI